MAQVFTAYWSAALQLLIRSLLSLFWQITRPASEHILQNHKTRLNSSLKWPFDFFFLLKTLNDFDNIPPQPLSVRNLTVFQRRCGCNPTDVTLVSQPSEQIHFLNLIERISLRPSGVNNQQKEECVESNSHTHALIFNWHKINRVKRQSFAFSLEFVAFS